MNTNIASVNKKPKNNSNYTRFQQSALSKIFCVKIFTIYSIKFKQIFQYKYSKVIQWVNK